MTPSPLVTILTPVYSHPPAYLDVAARSVFAQKGASWRWLIADDHSPPHVQARVESWRRDPRVVVMRQERNRGLFGNLNSALGQVDTPFVLLLCSDDRLRPDATERLLAASDRFPEADLILASRDGMGPNGEPVRANYASYHAMMTSTTRVLPRSEAALATLRFGSISGNLSGVFFRRTLFDRIGGFREDWTHAADWEWVCRVARAASIALCIDVVADVRYHPGQLTNRNLESGAMVREAADVIRALLHDPELRRHPRASRWAAHHMQDLAWLGVRAALRGDISLGANIAAEVSATTGILPTMTELVRWLPTRLYGRLRGSPPAPPV